MAKFSASARASVASTAARGPSLYAAASGVRPAIREVGVFNTTTTACVVSLTRLSARGTPGSGITVQEFVPDGPAAAATPYQTHTADATAADEVVRCDLGGQVGSGMVWTFSGDGLIIPSGANTNGIGLLCPTGTGQIIDFYIIWEE